MAAGTAKKAYPTPWPLADFLGLETPFYPSCLFGAMPTIHCLLRYFNGEMGVL